ncbi:ATPase family gene 2 protein homolog A [Brevipalpus obovatus]|uniref:ATPase family gene 2 protein homolog A n=1 Tax=Brevipalpus obovatus TaxID=246614 RepID=UPI003D9EDB5C
MVRHKRGGGGNPGVSNRNGLCLNDVGGLSEQIRRIKNLIEFPLRFGGDSSCVVNDLSHGIVLYGAQGTGKSLVIRALANELTPRINFLNIYGDMLSDNPLKEARESVDPKLTADSVEIVYKSKLDRLLNRALDCAPSVVVLDDIHLLCSSKKNVTDKENNFYRTLSTFLDENRSNKRVVVLAATNQLESVHDGLRRPGRLEEEIEFPVPSAAERLEILRKIFSKITHNIPETCLEAIAEDAHSYTGADLNRVYRESLYNCLLRRSETIDTKLINEKDVRTALRKVKPTSMREITLEVPKVYWKDIGGMERVKKKLEQAVVWPLKHPEAFTRLGIQPSKGVLMYGPPGCSKTMIGKALATESQLNFIAIKGPELFDKYVGESEKAVREIFRKAKQAAPAILFFDELDALASERGGSGSQSCTVGDRVLAQLLTEIDGIEELDGVTIVAATNRPDKVDMALLRPGRLDSIIYVPLPDTETRVEIFKIRMNRMSVSEMARENIGQLAESTTGYSGAEIVALCQEAALLALEEDMNAREVEMVHFTKAFEVVKPRTSSILIDFYSQYQLKNS